MSYQFYFLCVKGTHGGPEAIHQIVDKINRETDFKAHVVYFEKDFKPQEKFKDFIADYLPLSAVPDTRDTVLCASETHTYYLRKFKNAKKVMVWLSLDYYLRNIAIEKYGYKERKENFYGLSRLPSPFYPLLFVRDKLFLRKKHFAFDMDDVLHTYNCRYVLDYLKANGVKEENTAFLDGPVRQEYFNNNKCDKENIAAYNPKKGAEKYVGAVLCKLKENHPDLKTVPIENMTVEKVRNTLLRAKAYFDFGAFPGPEKLVKEAALCRCNIVTGMSGAAGNDSDILIPKECKFDMDLSDTKAVADAIYERVSNYETYVGDYDNYRNFIEDLNRNFALTVKKFTEFATR